MYTRAIVDLNFSAAPVGAEDCLVYLMLENTGSVPVEFSFLFPSDLQIELEYWAESGEYDDEELHEVKTMISTRLVFYNQQLDEIIFVESLMF